MEIDKHVTYIVQIKELTAGDTFLFDNKVYILTDSKNEVGPKAVNLETGVWQGFNQIQKVEQVYLKAVRVQ